MTRFEIYPPEPISNMWWGVVGLLVLIAVAVIVWTVLQWRRLMSTDVGELDSREVLRQETLAKIKQCRDDLASGKITNPQAAGQLSLLVRRFVGIVGNSNADYQTADQLQLASRIDSRLESAADLVTGLEPISFRPVADSSPMAAYFDRAVEVLEQWQ